LREKKRGEMNILVQWHVIIDLVAHRCKQWWQLFLELQPVTFEHLLSGTDHVRCSGYVISECDLNPI